MRHTYTVLQIANTPINVQPTVLVNLLGLWAILSFVIAGRHADLAWWQDAIMGALATLLLLVADFGHAVSHIFSARYAGAPMDEVRISAGMPRTLYENNDVPPAVHRLRATGGPVFSAVGLALSLIWLALVPAGSLSAELALWSSIGHGFIFLGSLAPLPIVDGGTLLKWTLVERGWTGVAADKFIHRLDLVLGAILLFLGLIALAIQWWLVAAVLVGIGLIVLSIALGIIR